MMTIGSLVALAACGEGVERPADLVLTGGVVWTGVEGQPPAEAVAVTDGRITAVGTADALTGFIGSGTRVVELDGRMVTPGFIDSHTHFISGGFQLSSVDLRDAGTPEEFTRRIAAFAEGLEPGQWITGGDWDHERWGGVLPRREWIDSVTPENPVLVSRLDGHMALANSLALEMGEVTADTDDPPGGTVVKDEATGAPTGILKDEAMGLVGRVMPEATEAGLDGALEAAARHALSLGVTQICDVGTGTWRHLETYRRAHERGALPLRVYAAVPISTWERLRDFVVEHGTGDDRLSWGGVKGFVDGSLGSTTAWFYEPYTDAPGTTGLMTTDTAQLRRWALDADAADLHLIIHAIGDRANDWLLDVYTQALEENGEGPRRFRIEHAQHLTPEAISRIAEMGVIPAMQPYHAIDDGRWAEKRIGPERIRTTYAFRSLLDAGAEPAFGSDWTVAPLDPLLGIYAAATRRTLDGENPDGWVPEEKIGVEEALVGYTRASARALYREDAVGTLEPTKLADLVVLSRNLLEIDPVEIPDVTVDLTFVEGEEAYARGAGTDG